MAGVMVVASAEIMSVAESRDWRTDHVGLERMACTVEAGVENTRCRGVLGIRSRVQSVLRSAERQLGQSDIGVFCKGEGLLINSFRRRCQEILISELYSTPVARHRQE